MRTNRPNVIVFFTDQQRWDSTGIHGNPLDLTPNFDRVAQRGTHVFHSYTCQPVCGPARACLQTGMYATVTGCFRNHIPLPPNTKTLAHYFREGGYTTGYIGKWHLAGETWIRETAGLANIERRLPGDKPVPLGQRGGYEYWLAANLLELCSDSYDTAVFDNENRRVKLPGYRVDALTDAAIRYIDEHRDQPFFLILSHLEPHHQNHLDDYPPPEGYRERYAGRWIPPDLAALGGSAHQHLAGYWGMVKRLDEAFGRLLDALKSMELLENTIMLFTSDHGCHFKTRNNEYKRSCHDSSIRVPTVLQGPGFDRGGYLDALISLIDLPPTLLDAAGLPVPTEMQGCSFMPLIRRQPVEWPDEVFIQISESQVGRAIRTKRWKYAVVARDKDGMHDPHADHYVEEFLYDLQADPYELSNLAGEDSHREVADYLLKRLVRCMVEAGEAPPRIDPVVGRL